MAERRNDHLSLFAVESVFQVRKRAKSLSGLVLLLTHSGRDIGPGLLALLHDTIFEIIKLLGDPLADSLGSLPISRETGRRVLLTAEMGYKVRDGVAITVALFSKGLDPFGHFLLHLCGSLSIDGHIGAAVFPLHSYDPAGNQNGYGENNQQRKDAGSQNFSYG